MTSATEWANTLGLAISPLFAANYDVSPGKHYAMLDGRRASFACSVMDATVDISQENSQNWQWSADLAHHVLITPDHVLVRSGRDAAGRKFRLDSVSSRLEQFLGFLDDSRSSALPDVVPFLVEEFRQMWAITGEQEGHHALTAFLFALNAADGDADRLDDAAWRQTTMLDIGIDPSLAPLHWSSEIADRARGLQARAPLGLRLIPSLVLRHAAGRLFQEAHAILESVQLGLFGEHAIETAPGYFPTGAYFTPVRIARLLADWSLRQLPTLPNVLAIADFACGSAIFLTEALRALERREFKGTVQLIGRDRSPQAVTMAKVAVRALERDMPSMKVTSDISQADALDADWPKADIILMNPPFRSWEQMNERERGWVHETTKGVGRGRPDLSVGFVERAVGALQPGGVMATLVPAGVLASDSLGKWRDALLQKVTPNLVAVLGEHGLFQHALVNVGVLALRSGPPSTERTPLYVAWSSSDDGAASRAIRGIRRSLPGSRNHPQSTDDVGGWSVTVTTIEAFKRRPSWLPGTGTLGSLLDEIQSQTDTNVGQMFDVHEGIKTGAKHIFIQPQSVVRGLPENEHRYFNEAVEGDNFSDGEIKPNTCLFVSDDTWETWDDVEKAVPVFFEKYLKHEQQLLGNRKADQKVKPWQLTRRRTWPAGRPRLLSKRFGLYPAFARDPRGKFAVVQAYAWVPTERLKGGLSSDELRELLTVYWWYFNSRVAIALLREFCPNVAGGQLDLSRKFVKHAPLPDLPRQLRENPALQELSTNIRLSSGDKLPQLGDRDRFAAEALGTNLSSWNLSGLYKQHS
ncbi:MAG TPA: N-6 DNA methylase [Bryobacteraceae bacterium]|nr:N-6 DNA methylase [Bryobacteraceae bacterium]HWR36997.1 N-6 DNA methylase [Clostridia bacterium]